MKSLANVLATMVACGVVMGGGSLCAETTSTVELLKSIPVGPADENSETSVAVSRMLELCAEAYGKVDALQAAGTYVHASKTEKDGETTFSTAKVSLNYLRPNMMSVVCESEDESLACAFYADGTTATHVSAEEKSYVALPQPETLAAYAENHRRGEIFTEFSGALLLSVTGPLLISEDSYKWLHEDVTRYVYEGKEEVAGAQCHRVRFIQEDPDLIVISWINEKTWLIDKVSFINSFDEDYNRVESFEEGDVASMSIMTWETKSTERKQIADEVFEPEVPAGFKLTPDEPATSTEQESKGWWGSIVGLAAETSPEETTWSLTRQAGTLNMRLDKFASVNPPIAELGQVPVAAGKPTQLALATESGQLTLLDADGKSSGKLQLGQTVVFFAPAVSDTSQPLYLAVDKERFALSAYDAKGTKLWQYHHPYATIKDVAVSYYPETDIYVALSGDVGIRKLDTSGKVQYATTKVEYISSLQSTPAGTDRIIARTSGLEFLDTKLHYIGEFDSDDEWIGSVKWDPDNQKSPVVCVTVTEDEDVLLQQRALNGDVEWTAMVEPKAEDVTGSAFSWVNLPVESKVQRCGCVFLSNGTIVLTTGKGDILYRGKVQANPALVKKNQDSVILFLAPADLNGDGVDEIYTLMGDNLMRLTPAQ